jgi:hypothetical protein
LLLEDCKRIIKHPDARAITPDLAKYSTLAEAMQKESDRAKITSINVAQSQKK